MSLSRGSGMRRAVVAALVVAGLSCAESTPAQGTIYRCHALNGDLLFQDKPCNAASGTREARANVEGDVVAIAPPPAQTGTSAAEHYSRYLDFVSKDRREQQAADEAQAARLRAQAAADRAEAAATTPAPASCAILGPDGACVASAYAPLYPYYAPVVRRPPYQGPYRTPPAAQGNPRSTASNPAPKRDARSEILSLAP